jgi:hypothetical protein
MIRASHAAVRSGVIASMMVAASCVGGPASTDCAGADWKAIGFQDGAVGARSKQFEQRADACADAGMAPDFAAYEGGRAQGLETYCTNDGGFAAGLSGAKYMGVCAPDVESDFLVGFNEGVRLYALRTAHEKAIDDYDGALADLDQHQYLLGVAEKRYAKPSISNEDREHERQEVEHRRREILRLEKALPVMLYGIESARAALDAYEVRLREAGRRLD